MWRNPVLEQATQQPAEYPPAGARQRVDRCGLAKADRLTQLRELREVDDLQQTQTTPPQAEPRMKTGRGPCVLTQRPAEAARISMPMLCDRATAASTCAAYCRRYFLEVSSCSSSTRLAA
ncbi:hypothetical protein Veis_3098 [Verminephrobacter eiseniae EF01-2]|uniref:Uncharacterized protein n=1 Tax=Verminephrobacter eiseniae (strain EF01-2) TaxID=391735 RepID=A1WMH4_VEREI|nr:hypothetical protein Veis_3098 [Verminephrobacter eiseniae EF01-2]